MSDIKAGRCRCGKRITEDGRGCQWHTAVQAEALAEIEILAVAHRFFIPARKLRALLGRPRG